MMPLPSGSPDDPDDLALGSWLLADEQVRWRQRAGGRVRWSRLLPILALELGLAGVALAEMGTTSRSTAAVPRLQDVFVWGPFVVVVVGTIVMALRLRQAVWYVVTDRRAAVFRPPSRLVSQAHVETPSFLARRNRPDGAAGSVDWGRADGVIPPPPPGRLGGLSGTWGRSPSRSSGGLSGPLLGLPSPGRVEFLEVHDLDGLMPVIRSVRSAWRVGTPEPASTGPRRAPIPLGFCDSRRAGLLNTIVLVAGLICLVGASALLLATLVPGGGTFSFGAVVPFFVMAFPLGFWTVALISARNYPGESPFSLGRGRSRQSPAGFAFPFENLPRRAIALVIGAFVGCCLIASSVIGGSALTGQPSYDRATGQYTIDDHGTVTVVTKARYDRAITAQNRLFLSGALAFAVVSVGATSDELLRRRRSPFVERRAP